MKTLRFISAAAATLVVAAGFLASCRNSSTPTAPTGPAVAVSLRISGPSTVAPGSTAPFSAQVIYSDGSNKDVTTAVQWYSSATSILTVSATGVASAIQSGDVVISATFNNAQGGVSAGKPIEVVPSGPFRLSGTVTGFGAQLDGALVQVTAGVGAGLSATTSGGFFRLYGVAGNIQLSVNKDMYVAITKAVTVTANDDNLNFDLLPVNPPPNLAGAYTLRITADSACATDGAGILPAIGRDRRYTATISQTESSLHVVLSGAAFMSDRNSFYGNLVALDTATSAFYLDSYFYYKVFDVVEVLPDGSGNIYALDGEITVARPATDLVGTFNGRIVVKTSASGVIVGQCTSTHHGVTFTKTGGSPSRTRTGR